MARNISPQVANFVREMGKGVENGANGLHCLATRHFSGMYSCNILYNICTCVLSFFLQSNKIKVVVPYAFPKIINQNVE
jgi:hypothetical protein